MARVGSRGLCSTHSCTYAHAHVLALPAPLFTASPFHQPDPTCRWGDGSGTLQQLGFLRDLQRLRLGTAITGCLTSFFPASFSGLTCLEVCGSNNSIGSLDSSLALLPRLRRLSWERTDMLFLGWPEGIAALSELTYLSLREPILLSEMLDWEEPQPPPNLSALTRLAHLHIDGRMGEAAWELPDLQPLGPSLRCLRCGRCEGAPIVHALPQLTGLTALLLSRCDLSAAGPEVDLRHMTGLQHAFLSGDGPRALLPATATGEHRETVPPPCPEHWPPREDLSLLCSHAL